MTMADSSIRKACDRCHTQKLSCKRVGEEPCERCTRLNAECKSSPSLRYKKQQHQLQLQQQEKARVSHPHPHPHPHQYHQQPAQPHRRQHIVQPHQQQQLELGPPQAQSAETVQVRSRSPKRRRTDSDPRLVLPDAVPITSCTGGITTKAHPGATPETLLDISGFNFNFDQLGFFAPSQLEHLSQPGISTRLEDFHPTNTQGLFANPWDSHPSLPPSSNGFDTTTPSSVPHTDINLSPRPIPSAPRGSRGGVPEHGVSDKRARHRPKHRPRQIALRRTAPEPQISEGETIPVHWMAQLNDINTRLLGLASGLPQPHEAANKGLPLGRPKDERFKVNGFPVDEMFQLTRRVADILDQFSNMGPKTAGQTPLDGSNPADSMLVLSTYVRLLNMYQRIFDLVSTELAHTDAKARFQFWKLPDVSVGSFAVESSPSLQMSLTLQLAEEFLGRLRTSAAALDSSLHSEGGYGQVGSINGGSLFSGVVDVSYQAIKSREEGLGKHLASLRAEIEALLES